MPEPLGDVYAVDMPAGLGVPFGLVRDGFRKLGGVVGDMGADELGYQGPQGDVNSSATILAHLARTDLDYLHCIKGEPVPDGLAARYPEDRDATGTLVPSHTRSAADLLAAYAAVLDMCGDYLRTCDDAAAERPVTVPWWPEPATVRFVLWHMAYHSAYHQGQIARLRAWWRQARTS